MGVLTAETHASTKKETCRHKFLAHLTFCFQNNVFDT